jgi:uncharacterized damage-inducible protein DinB
LNAGLRGRSEHQGKRFQEPFSLRGNDMTEERIAAFVQGGEALQRGIEGLSREQLLWQPPTEAGVGLWSIQQIVIHLLDCDLIWTARMKQMIAEDNPRLLGYDHERFAANLFYQEQSAAEAAMILSLNRRNFARVLRMLPPEAWDRTGRHSERGEVRLRQSIELVDRHARYHLDFIDRKRAKMGER